MVAPVSVSRRKGGRRTSLRRTFSLVPFPLFFFTLSSSEGPERVRTTICLTGKGGRFMSLRKAFGLVTCPLLFFTLSSSSHSHCCFFEGSECARASTYLSLQGWQVYVF